MARRNMVKRKPDLSLCTWRRVTNERQNNAITALNITSLTRAIKVHITKFENANDVQTRILHYRNLALAA